MVGIDTIFHRVHEPYTHIPRPTTQGVHVRAWVYTLYCVYSMYTSIMDVCMYACMYVYVCMHVCMCVCMYVLL